MKTFRFRLIFLLAVLLAWGGMAAGALLYYGVINREKYLERGNQMALRQGTLQAPRGRILDRNGVVLAWTEKYFDLFLVNPSTDNIEQEMMMKELRLTLQDCEPEVVNENTWLLKANLSPFQMLGLDPLLRSYPELQVIPREERMVVDYSEVRKIIGKTGYRDEVMTGQSGAEKQYNVELTGTPGEYEVMLDRRRNWIAGTWKLLVPAIPGDDVKLDFSLSELLEAGH